MSRPGSRAWKQTSLFREGKNHPELYGQPKPISKLGKVQLTFISYKMAKLLVSMPSCSFWFWPDLEELPFPWGISGKAGGTLPGEPDLVGVKGFGEPWDLLIVRVNGSFPLIGAALTWLSAP